MLRIFSFITAPMALALDFIEDKIVVRRTVQAADPADVLYNVGQHCC